MIAMNLILLIQLFVVQLKELENKAQGSYSLDFGKTNRH